MLGRPRGRSFAVSTRKDYVLIGLTQQVNKLEFGGELGIDSLRRGRVSVPLHSSLFTVSPNPLGRFSRLLREAKRLPYALTNWEFVEVFVEWCAGGCGTRPCPPHL